MSDFHTEELSKCNFYPLILREISVLTELHLGRMRYRFTYEPPQPNSPSEIFLHQDLSSKRQSIDTQQSLPDTQMGIVMGLNPGRGVRGLLHRTHRLSLSHPTYSFRDEGGPHALTGAPHFLILMLEAGGADEPRPPFLRNAMREIMFKVEVFHWPPKGPSYATPPKSFLNSN